MTTFQNFYLTIKTHALLLVVFMVCIFSASFSVLANGAESNDFILIDTEFAGSQALGETAEEYEEAKLIDIQRIGESQSFIEADMYCGNGRMEGNEKCDGNDFNGMTCGSFGGSIGTLQCNSSCSAIILTNCSVPSSAPSIVVNSGGGSNGGNSSGGGGSDAIIVSSLTNSGTASQPSEVITESETDTPLHSAPSPTETPEQIEATESNEENEGEQGVENSDDVQEKSPIDNRNDYIESPSIIPQSSSESSLESSLLKASSETIITEQEDYINTDNTAITIPASEYSDFSSLEGINFLYALENKNQDIGNTFKDDYTFLNGENSQVCMSSQEFSQLQNGGTSSSHWTLFCWIYILLALLIGFFIRHFMHFFSRYKNMKTQQLTAGLLCVVMGGLFFSPSSLALTPEIPHTLIYEGRLLSKTQTALTGDYTMRFSFWNTVDSISSEMNSDGSLNQAAAQYGGWAEELPVSFTDQGYFSLILGNQTFISDIALAQHKYLQVEVKKTTESDSEYQILDVDFSNDLIDRKHVASLPYAFNAEESITSHVAENAAGNVFILDPENTVETAGTGMIALQFGQTLAKMLSYDFDRSVFSFNDSVEINGGLSLVSSTGSASFSADGLTGDNIYSLPDEDALLVGESSTQTLTNKTIDATQNSIINLSADSLVPTLKKQTITPLFPNSTFEANTANNQLSVFMGEENQSQYYKASTEKTSVQTGVFLITLPLEEFDNFDSGSLAFTMKTDSGNVANNSVSIRVKDENGTLLASLLDQTTAGVWETKTVDLTGLSLSSHLLLLEITPEVSSGNEVFISSVSVEYNGK